MLEKFKAAASYIKGRVELQPTVGIILGTGLGGLVNEIEIVHEIAYEDIPHFPVSTVKGHSGKLIFGKLGGKSVVAMQGRFHEYGGYTLQVVTLRVRGMKF